MLVIVHACAITGLDGVLVDVEVDFNPRAGIPSFIIVGLPNTAVRESRERIRSAIKNTGRYSRKSPSFLHGGVPTSLDQKQYSHKEHRSGLQFPNKGYVVNLSPADLPKQGASYDLAIAVGVLASTDQLPLKFLEKAMFIGELSLDGTIRHVDGVMPRVHTALREGFTSVYVPAEDAVEASLIQNIDVYPVESLGQLVEHAYGLNPIEPFIAPDEVFAQNTATPDGLVDFSDIKGQEHIKRALEIAAAGNHNLLMTGVPGAGKSLSARAMPGILPPLTMEEALEVTRIYSVAGMLSSERPLMMQRPFRSPHHTISQAGLVGGGSNPKPGEISLAHRGVLFLDEIVEHSTRVLEVMRQPIEDKVVTISRASGTITFPANFLLVAARNPCPCGNYGDPVKPCSCSPTMIQRYQAKLSGPLLDRIDIHVDVMRVDYDKLMSSDEGESSADVRSRVVKARQRQYERFKDYNGLFANGDMTVSEIQKLCVLKPDAKQLLELSVRRMQLSARAYHRVMKLSRTIADLAGTEMIEVPHVAEALQYRPKEGI